MQRVFFFLFRVSFALKQKELCQRKIYGGILLQLGKGRFPRKEKEGVFNLSVDISGTLLHVTEFGV